MDEAPAIPSDVDASTRLYFDSLESAIGAFSLPLENRTMVREIARLIPYSSIYIPSQSRSYIALVDPDVGQINAAIHSGYVSFHARVADRVSDYVLWTDDGPWCWTELPKNSIREGGGSRALFAAQDYGTCGVCWMALPASGQCDNCA